MINLGDHANNNTMTINSVYELQEHALHDGSLIATYGWLLKRPSATYGWSLKTFSDP
jgi:hypothetical protein